MAQLSNSESRTLCRRVFSALGYPAGSDTEIADGVVWLAATGIQPLNHLAHHLARLQYCASPGEHDFSLPDRSEFDIQVRESADYAALLVALDLLCAQAVRTNQTVSATIENMQQALILFPLALRRSGADTGFEIECSRFRAVLNEGQLWTSVGLRKLAAKAHEDAGVLRCIPIASRKAQFELDRSGLEIQIDQNAENNPGRGRLDLDIETLQALKSKAAETFVPNSELSRKSGAGAEVDDSK